MGGASVTYGDLFTGFGGATLGARAARLTPLWGFEMDAQIAAVANANLDGHVHVANILDVDPRTLPAVDVLHASPPCPNFSVAKTGGVETELDIALARKVAQFVNVIQPRFFTLENVYAYRQSKSWTMIQESLFNLGYWVNVEHVNFADLGVPQTRKRMIVRAVRGGWVPHLPVAQRWVGWYEAIEDLIPSLPETQFAPWQLKRLTEKVETSLWTTGRSYDQHGNEYGAVVRSQHEPSVTVRAHSGPDRAFIVGGQYEKSNTADERIVQNRSADEPLWTVTPKESANTRTFIVDGQNGSRPPTIKMAHEPIMTVLCYDTKHPAPKAFTGKVVAMTPRALARFQSFPDWYRLPDGKSLAARGIGNAVPPLGYQRIIEGLVS